MSLDGLGEHHPVLYQPAMWWCVVYNIDTQQIVWTSVIHLFNIFQQVLNTYHIHFHSKERDRFWYFDIHKNSI